MKKWWYTILLGLFYPAVFHAWIFCASQNQVRLIATIVAVFLFLLGTIAYKKYFYGGFDYAAHMSIPLDIFLEGYFIYPHDNYFFYGCWIGFALVLVPFRIHKSKKFLQMK